MKTISLIIMITLLSLNVFAEATAEQPDRNIEEYNFIQGNLGLKGYDPVSYFVEGGGIAMPGSAEINVTYGGVRYFFSSEENKALFLDEPLKYEPTYGGYCAWAMAFGDAVDIDPTIYTIVKYDENGSVVETDGEDPDARRSHFFVAPGAKFRFDRELGLRESDADQFWYDISGELERK